MQSVMTNQIQIKSVAIGSVSNFVNDLTERTIKSVFFAVRVIFRAMFVPPPAQDQINELRLEAKRNVYFSHSL